MPKQNYETHIIWVWLTNDQKYYKILQSIIKANANDNASAHELKTLITDSIPDRIGGVWLDLINVAIERVNWLQIIQDSKEV